MLGCWGVGRLKRSLVLDHDVLHDKADKNRSFPVQHVMIIGDGGARSHGSTCALWTTGLAPSGSAIVAADREGDGVYDPKTFELGGDPGAIRDSVARWMTFSTSAAIAATELTAAAATSASEFLGDEGSTHADRLRAELAPQLGSMGEAWMLVAGALARYSVALEGFQAELRRLGGEAVEAVEHHIRMTLSLPSSDGRTSAAQVELSDTQQRAMTVHGEHAAAQRLCCSTIARATALAPPSLAGVGTLRGSSASLPMGSSTVAIPPVLVSTAARLRVAAVSSTRVPFPIGPTVRHSLRGGSAAFEPAPDDDSDGVIPVQGSTADLHRRLYSQCMMDQALAGMPDSFGLDAAAACLGFADSAISDPHRLTQALEMYPSAAGAVLPPQSPWAALWEGVTMFVTFGATVTGLDGCLRADPKACGGELLSYLAFGAVGRAASLAARAAKATASAKHAGTKARNLADRADAGKQANNGSRGEPGAKNREAPKAESPDVSERVDKIREAVKPTKAGQIPVPEAWLPLVARKIPKDWKLPSRGKFGKDSRGRLSMRIASEDGRDTVRIDLGNPSSPMASQRVDHVSISSNGQKVGRTGQKLPSNPKSAEEQVEIHIPLSEWKEWSTWDHP